MYRLVAIDLDGTLLNSYGEVSKKNKEAIENAISKGTEIVFASGRPISSVLNLAEETGANHYVICGNGSIVYDVKKEQILYKNFLDKKKVLQIIKICEENSIYYSIYTEDFIIAKSLNYHILFFNYENMRKPDDRKTNIKIVDNVYQYIENSENQNYLKITICDSNQVIFGGIIRKLRQIRNIDVLDVEHMARKMIKSGTEDIMVEYYYTEITSQNVNKWYAIEDLISLLNISKEEVMTIGDNVNDQLMVEKAGLGIMMGNSAPYIQSVADIVVADNNQDGVAQALEEYIN